MFVCILPEKAIPEMTYTVSGGTLNPTHSLTHPRVLVVATIIITRTEEQWRLSHLLGLFACFFGLIWMKFYSRVKSGARRSVGGNLFQYLDPGYLNPGFLDRFLDEYLERWCPKTAVKIILCRWLHCSWSRFEISVHFLISLLLFLKCGISQLAITIRNVFCYML